MSIVCLYVWIILPGPACVTVAGPAVAGSPCIFPFTYQGQTYTKCAKYLDSNQVKQGYKRAPRKRGMSVNRTFLSKGRANAPDNDKTLRIMIKM